MPRPRRIREIDADLRAAQKIVTTKDESKMKRIILVVGGYGNFGRHISAALAAEPHIACIIAGRHPQRAEAFAAQIGARTAMVDAHHPSTIAAVLPGVYAVVNACGPFQKQSYHLAEQCIRHGVHYVDLADTRAYVMGIHKLHQRATDNGCAIVSGAGSVPAVVSTLVDSLVPEFDKIGEIHTALSVGNKSPFGEATLEGVLSNLGKRMRIKERGQWREVRIWSRPSSVKFPAPLGRRRTYLCDAPDLEIFPQRYGAQTVSFRVGAQLRVLNYALSLIGWGRRRTKIQDPSRYASMFMKLDFLLGGFGDAMLGISVALSGSRSGQALTHQLYLLARDKSGPMISCSPAIALIKKWVQSGVQQPGAFPCVGLVNFAEIKNELKGHDIVIVRA